MDRNIFVNRLQELRGEYATGGQQLAELDRRREDLRATLLRIEGAIQVLEEELANSPEVFAAGSESSADQVASD